MPIPEPPLNLHLDIRVEEVQFGKDAYEEDDSPNKPAPVST